MNLPVAPKYRVVTVPTDSIVEVECVQVPQETPYGMVQPPELRIVEGSAWEIRFDGERYHLMSLEAGPHSTLHSAIDVETGEVVFLRFPGTFLGGTGI